MFNVSNFYSLHNFVSGKLLFLSKNVKMKVKYVLFFYRCTISAHQFLSLPMSPVTFSPFCFDQ